MAAKFFRKIGDGANKFFGKIRHDAPGIMQKISNGLGDAGKFIGNGLGQVSKITNSPLAQTIAGGLGLTPELAGFNKLLGAGQQASQQGFHALQTISNPSTYKGSPSQVGGNIAGLLQKSVPVSNAMIMRPSFS